MSVSMHALAASRRAMLLAGLISALLLPVPVAARYDPEKVYREAPAVAARYPDPAVAYPTPAFAPGKADFTSHAEMMAFLSDLDARASRLRMLIAGTSQEGRAISALLLTASGDDAGFEDAGRPTVLLVGLQHGNEPAGGEAMLVLAQRLAEGELADLLARINVVIVPRANPDGAEVFQRNTKNGINLNRDHTLLRTPEGQALGRIFRAYAPQVVVDAHEFTVAGRWLKTFGAVRRPDAMIQHATTANLLAELAPLQETFRQAMTAALDAAGLTHDWYYATYDKQSRTVAMGGIGADMGRNAAGLRHAVSFLVETRGLDLGRAHWARRVHTHVVAAETLLRATADRAAEVIAASAASRHAVAATPPGSHLTVLAAQTPERRTVMFIDPNSGADVAIEVDWRSSLTITPVLSRPRPAAYVLAPGEVEAAHRLVELGISVIRTAKAARLAAETYKLVALAETAKADVGGTDEGAGAILKGAFAVERAEVDIPAGSHLVPLDQPLANLATAVFEPESPVGYVANRVIAVPESGVLPILRLVSGAEAPMVKGSTTAAPPAVGTGTTQ
jgi:predicted deacylase